MTDTTTIEIPETQRDELKQLKAHDREPYYEVIDRLLHATDASDKAAGVDADAIADTVAERVGATLSEVTWEQLDAADLAQQTAAYVEQRSNVTLEASERRAIAQEVAEELQR